MYGGGRALRTNSKINWTVDMSEILAGVDLSQASDAELMRLERQIASKYMNRLSIPMVLWPLTNIAVWLSL